MELGEFDESNDFIGGRESSFRVYRDYDSDEGLIVFCWKLNFFERLQVLFTGRVWHHVLLNGERLQECAITIEKPVMVMSEK